MRVQRRYHIPKYVFSQTADDYTILYNSRANRRVGLDPMATCFWQLMQVNHTLAQVLDDLGAIFSVPEKTLRDDLDKFYRQMLAMDLLCEAEGE